jgi:uncharacterized protein (DUF58 family)
MQLRAVPSSLTVIVLAVCAAVALSCLLLGMSVAQTSLLAAVMLSVLVAVCALDFLRSRSAWQAADLKLERQLPAAFAIGVERPVKVAAGLQGSHDWRVQVHDHADASLLASGLPRALTFSGSKITEFEYTVTPTRRGEITFSPADVRLRSRMGLLDLFTRAGTPEVRRVYPDFAQVARYAWLAGDRRLAEIGIKTFQQRGEGTDFNQLAEYRTGDAVRHIDWKATLRFGKPIVRQFQNERDQCVMLLIDCGRRMRADDRTGGIGSSHFDQVLNATMLLTYVALKQGDAVGAMTFGTPPGEERWFTPRKGAVTLNALMGELYDVQPTPTHSDYLAAAQAFLRRQRKRALVIVITNFRDEDSSELGRALTLLRSRHIVMTASLREGVVRQLMEQPLASADSALDIASAHLFEQSRRDAFNRISARDSLMVDAEPERLGIELVNRYHAVKRAGMI